MKKVISLSLLMTGFGQAAFASHPHDRVCVASGPIDFVFQYAIGRTYENGNANKDSHKIAAEASYSSDDYLSKAEKFTSEIVTMKSQSTKIAIALKSSRGEVLFNGIFDFSNEKLIGTFMGGQEGKSVKASVKMNCVSQSLLTLESSDRDILD